MENIELSEMIGQLRRELSIAQSEGAGSDLKFQIEDIEIELQVVTTKSGEVGSGVKLSVINFGAKVNASEAETQRLKLRLKLVGRDGQGEVLVSDTDQRD